MNFDNRHNLNMKKKHEVKKKPVKCITTGEIFESAAKAERVTGVGNQNISKCCLGRRGFKTAGKTNDGRRRVWRFFEF